MPARAKRFYLCNLIPLWEVDEENVDVDWPIYHAYFGDLIELRADVRRKIQWGAADDPSTVHPDLKIRFEVYESDFLLTGGLNDQMAVFSSHKEFGSDVSLKPIQIVKDIDNIPEEDRERFIFIHWRDAHEVTINTVSPDGTTSSSTKKEPDTLQIRAWWRVTEEAGGDVSGNPEYYYDFYLTGRMEGGQEVELHERSDHELVGMSWNVTDRKRQGSVAPLVDGEYAFLKMLELLDGAQHSIHILNWKMDPQATLVVESEFKADYLQVPGLDQTSFARLLNRCKALTLGVSAQNGSVFFSTSNGNVMSVNAADASISVAVQQIDDPTNLDLPSAVAVLDADKFQVLVLDQLRSRLLLFLVVERSDLQEVASGLFALLRPPSRALPFYELNPTLPSVMSQPELVAGFIPLAGDGNPGWHDAGLVDWGALNPGQALRGGYTPVGKLNHPSGLVVAANSIFITDTDNHCIRKIADFNPAGLGTTLAFSSLTLTTLSGQVVPGDADGTGSAARFRSPSGIAWDTIGNRLLIADTGNRKLRSVDPVNGAATTLTVTRIDGAQGSLREIFGLAFNGALGSKGTLYVSERDSHRILAINLETLEASTLAGSRTGEAGYRDNVGSGALFNQPLTLSFDNGKLFVADSRNHVIRVIDSSSGAVHTIGSPTTAGVQDVPVVLADVLRRKAQEGVDVRILLDGYGSGIARDVPTFTRNISIGGAQTVSDLGFLHPRIRAFVQNHVQSLFGRALASYHEKMMVVDGRWGVLGGIDFDDDKNDGLLHNRTHRVSVAWHDVAAFVQGKAALGLEEAFIRRWQMAREELATDHPAILPDVIQMVDRTDASLGTVEAEMVRTFDPTPLLGVLVNLIPDEVKEILESYRRLILGARHYIYMEHQYLYYPEISDFLEQAMQDNPKLHVIWTLPFFTEETQDPTQERAELVQEHRLATSIIDASQLLAGNQLRSQVAWHGFFRQREMVEKLRKIDRSRFGVFSLRHLVRPSPNASPESKEIYPHSKMILCDDRIFSLGSANANGRGFTKDGELNVSALAPAAGRALRERLWGEHLGYLGVAQVRPDGSLFPFNGHHFKKQDIIRLRHPALGELDRRVDLVDPNSGSIFLEGTPLDPRLGRVFWQDPTFSGLQIQDALGFWRRSCHPLATYQKIQGYHATTNSSGDLIVEGNLAAPGDQVVFGKRLMLLNDEGRSAHTQPLVRKLISGTLPVASVSGNAIRLGTGKILYPLTDALQAMKVGDTTNIEPFRVRLVEKVGGRARLELLGLMPGLRDVPFDYKASWLDRQPGGKKWLRAWEIDPPEGIQYGGPGTVLFSPWLLLPWLFVDFNPDEQARLDIGPRDQNVV